jgi:hypothetical protein
VGNSLLKRDYPPTKLHGVIIQKVTDVLLLDVLFGINVSIRVFLHAVVPSFATVKMNSFNGELIFVGSLFIFLRSYVKVALANTRTLKCFVRSTEVRSLRT